MSSPTTDKYLNLLEQSNFCAKKMAVGWIRSVFQQVCIQILARLWKTQHDEEKTRLHISQQDLDACERTCIQLGSFWCQRLRDSGQTQVAEWVNEVVEEKKFWELNDSDDGNVSQQNNAREEENPAKVQPKIPTELPSKNVEPIPLPASGSKHILSKIRSLGERKKIGDGPPPLDRVSRTLDELGRSGQTEWPYDWSIIEEAAKQNFKRLHTETIKGRPLATQKPSGDNYQVVPKSLVEREQQQLLLQQQQLQQQQQDESIKNEEQQEIDAIMASHGKLSMMVERKRKAAAEPDEAIVTTAPSPAIETLARPPSSFGNDEQLSWKDDVLASLSEHERHQLQRTMLHPAQEDEESHSEFNSVLGGLQNVGSYHLYLQNKDNRSYIELSANKKRRLERKARKQRLFPHEMAKQDNETRRAVTKVVRAIDRNEQDWMELDMGKSLLEVVDAGHKKLYAFSSLEVMLKDHNTMAAIDDEEETS